MNIVRSSLVIIKRILEKVDWLRFIFVRKKVDVKLVHFGYHIPRNAGDTLLFYEVREVLGKLESKIGWWKIPLDRNVDSGMVQKFNSSVDGVVIGGGGLFLKDTNSNANSGWQWDIPLEDLRNVKVPLILFAVGYNRFRNQDDFSEGFTEHLKETVSKSIFFGLRNRGSIREIIKYLPAELRDKAVYQPCPTTILKFTHPQYYRGGISLKEDKRLALNVAYDRSEMRFGDRLDKVNSQIAAAMELLRNKGWNIDLVVHCPKDAEILPYLRSQGLKPRVINLHRASVEKILGYYSAIPLTVGMRGHAQMIPFGFGNAIVSLVSHEKLKWFLEDVDMTDYYVELDEDGIDSKIVEKVDLVEQGHDELLDHIANHQDELYKISLSNIKKIQKKLNVRK